MPRATCLSLHLVYCNSSAPHYNFSSAGKSIMNRSVASASFLSLSSGLRLQFTPGLAAHQKRRARHPSKDDRYLPMAQRGNFLLVDSQAPRIREISARLIKREQRTSRSSVLSSGIVTARSSVNLPERVRRNALRCAPQPRTSPMSLA